METKTCETQCRSCAARCHRQYGDYPTGEEALELFFREQTASLGIEYVGLKDALGRVTAEETYAAWDLPTANVATHDGFAVCYEFAKARENAVFTEKEYIRLCMGELLPEGVDTLLPSELCIAADGGGIRVLILPHKGEGVTKRGSVIRKGERVIPVNTELNAFHLCILRHSGIEQVPVFQKPRVFILPVGDDLAVPGEVPGPGRTPESDGILLYAMARECGANAVIGDIVADDEAKIGEAMKSALPKCDLLVVIGGFGRERERFNDHTVNAIEKVGRVLVHGTLVSAGKASLLGVAEGCCILGIPGPPHAAAAVAEAFLPEILGHMLGCRCYKRQFTEAVLGEDYPLNRKADWTPRVYLHREEKELVATFISRMGDTVENFADASAWILLKGNSGPFQKGDRVIARLLNNHTDGLPVSAKR